MKFTKPICLISCLFPSGILATISSGCGKVPSKIKPGINTMTINNKTREWILTVPDNYNNTKPHRVIFGLHWWTGTMTDVANDGVIQPYYGLQSLSDNSAIFIAPNGLVADGRSGWANSGGEDIKFIQEIVRTVDEDLCVDENLRFSVGFSYGAAMSYSVACTLGKQFRAVAALSGGPLSGCEGGTDPVAYYGQHGVVDSVLPITLGRQLRDTFVKNNGCSAQQPSEPTSGSKTHIVTKYAGCSTGKPVWWTAFDGDHTPTPADTGANKSSTYTGTAVWDFFSQFT